MCFAPHIKTEVLLQTGPHERVPWSDSYRDTRGKKNSLILMRHRHGRRSNTKCESQHTSTRPQLRSQTHKNCVTNRTTRQTLEHSLHTIKVSLPRQWPCRGWTEWTLNPQRRSKSLRKGRVWPPACSARRCQTVRVANKHTPSICSQTGSSRARQSRKGIDATMKVGLREP